MNLRDKADRDHLSAGRPVEVVGFRCPRCGPTTIICDDYAVLSPLDGGGVQPLSGACSGCSERVEFCTAVSLFRLSIPAGVSSTQEEIKGGESEPIIPE